MSEFLLLEDRTAMEMIASLWWLWTSVIVFSVSYVLRVQYLKTRAISNVSKHIGHTVTGVLSRDPHMIGESVQRVTNEVTQGLFSGLGKAAAAVMVAIVSGVLLLISIVANLINYFASSF